MNMENIITITAIGLFAIFIVLGQRKLSKENSANTFAVYELTKKMKKIDTRLEYSRKRELKILKRLKGGKK